MKPISLEKLDDAFELIGKKWLLLTVKDENPGAHAAANPMTASWGGLGVLWNKPVVFLFVRPQRYTFGLIEKADRLTVSVLPEDRREAMRLCGRLSGKDTDKFFAAGLSCGTVDGLPYPAEADLTLVCRKLYAGDLKEECFIDKALLSNYNDGDFHRMIVCEIEGAYRKEEQ